MKQSFKRKVAAVLMAALVGITAVPAMAAEDVSTSTAGQSSSLEAAEAGYKAVLQRYRIVRDADYFDGDWEMLDRLGVNNLIGLSKPENVYFTLCDLANDGVPEIFVASMDSPSFTINDYGWREGGYRIHDIWGCANGTISRPFPIDSMGYRANYSFMNNGVMFCQGSSGAMSNYWEYYTLGTNSAKAYLSNFIEYDGWEGEKYYRGYGNLNNKWRVSKAEKDRVVKSYSFVKNIKWYSIDDAASLHQAIRSFSIPVMINGSELACDQPAVSRNGRTLVPLRAIFEALGTKVEWNGATQTITAVKGSTTVQMRLNSKTMSKNGQSIALDVPPQAIAGRTMVPVRAIADAFDYNVYWDSANRVVEINN